MFRSNPFAAIGFDDNFSRGGFGGDPGSAYSLINGEYQAEYGGLAHGGNEAGPPSWVKDRQLYEVFNKDPFHINSLPGMEMIVPFSDREEASQARMMVDFSLNGENGSSLDPLDKSDPLIPFIQFQDATHSSAGSEAAGSSSNLPVRTILIGGITYDVYIGPGGELSIARREGWYDPNTDETVVVNHPLMPYTPAAPLPPIPEPKKQGSPPAPYGSYVGYSNTASPPTTGIERDTRPANGSKFDDSWARSHQEAGPTPASETNRIRRNRVLTFDTPPNQLPSEKLRRFGIYPIGYSFVHGLKESIYNPIKSLFLDERPKFLDENQHVQTVPWRPDHRDAIPAIAPFLVGPLTDSALVLGVARQTSSTLPSALASAVAPSFEVGGNSFVSITDAEIEAFAPAWESVTAPDYFRVPISATEAGIPVEDLVPVSRWGRSGLEPGDWVVPGAPSQFSTYARSFKWEDFRQFASPELSQALGLNEYAPFATGQGFAVPPQSVRWPSRILNKAFKGLLFKQRQYIP